MSQQLTDFCQRYSAEVGPCHKVYARYEPLSLQRLQDNGDNSISDVLANRRVPGVTITMPEDRFRALIEHDLWMQRIRKRSSYIGDEAGEILKRHERECILRHEHPALQSAWQQYQIMLAMIGGAE